MCFLLIKHQWVGAVYQFHVDGSTTVFKTTVFYQRKNVDNNDPKYPYTAEVDSGGQLATRTASMWHLDTRDTRRDTLEARERPDACDTCEGREPPEACEVLLVRPNNDCRGALPTRTVNVDSLTLASAFF